MGAMAAELALQEAMATALELDDGAATIVGAGTLDSAYPVSELAAASIATAAVAAADLCDAVGISRPSVTVDRALACAWFGYALVPIGWDLPSPWDAMSGDYPTLADDQSARWIRLHTNAPRHRAAALRVLGVAADRQHVGAAVARWVADELETAILEEGGCAAALRSPADWAAHPQGLAVASEPLVAIEATDAAGGGEQSHWTPTPERPLAGLRVLDLTRVLAGPVATRTLAALGADVLRVDPPDWDEPGLVPDMTVGKRAARLDAGDPADRERLLDLLAGADVLVHGYRLGALDHLGLPDSVRRTARPGLIDVSLTAYGDTGPWATRRGFDSLVQMSTGIAGVGLRQGIADRPTPLPVQALDHATGYLMAAAVLTGLTRRVNSGRGMRGRVSLARTASELEAARSLEAGPVGPARFFARMPVATPWGAATLPSPPFSLTGVDVGWERGPRALGSDAPTW